MLGDCSSSTRPRQFLGDQRFWLDRMGRIQACPQQLIPCHRRLAKAARHSIIRRRSGWHPWSAFRVPSPHGIPAGLEVAFLARLRWIAVEAPAQRSTAPDSFKNRLVARMSYLVTMLRPLITARTKPLPAQPEHAVSASSFSCSRIDRTHSQTKPAQCGGCAV